MQNPSAISERRTVMFHAAANGHASVVAHLFHGQMFMGKIRIVLASDFCWFI